MVTMTHEQELNLERFANLMVELIERHADAVDKAEMENRINLINKSAGNEKFPAFSLLVGIFIVCIFDLIFHNVIKLFGRFVIGNQIGNIYIKIIA